MTTVQITANGKTTERSFDSYRKAVKFYNSCIAEMAPNGKRRTSVYDIDHIANNVIRLMRGRFVEECVEF